MYYCGADAQTLLLAAVMCLTTFGIYPYIWFSPSGWLRLTGGSGGTEVRAERAIAAFKYAVAAHKALVASIFASGWGEPAMIVVNALNPTVTGMAATLAALGV